MTLEPRWRWRWSKDVKPIVNTNSCQNGSYRNKISGRLHVKMDDETEQEFSPGEVSYVPPGHDAGVVGNEPFVAIAFTGMKEYAATSKK
jgi:hypothetical protein